MIRDEIKDVKTVTKKENRKKLAMGERAYYAKQIPRLKDLTKAMSFSIVFTLILITLAWAVVLFVFIFGENETVRFVIWTSIYGALLLFSAIWFLFIKPANLKKAERYRKELERLNAESLSKMAGAYRLYGAEYKNFSGNGARDKKTEEEKSDASDTSENP